MENVSNISSEEELLQLRNEGKISEAEYQDLLATMRKPPASDKEAPGEPSLHSRGWKGHFGSNEIPSILWIALVSLGLMILAKLLLVSKFGPLILLDAVLSAALLVGLYLGHKWAYVLTIVFVALGTFLACSKDISQGLGVAALNCLVLVPVLMCTDSFFSKSPADSGGE